MQLAALLEVSSKQYGMVTRDQALALMTRGQFDHLVTTGVLVRTWQGVYEVRGTLDSWQKRASGVLLSVTNGALSHGSAARLLGLTYAQTDALHVTVPHGQSPLRKGVLMHRSRQLDAFVDRSHEFPITNAARTFVDVSTLFTLRQLGAIFDQGCNKNLFTIDEVDHCMLHMVTKGRPWISRIRDVLKARGLTDENLDSFLERRTLRWIRSAGLPEPRSQLPLIANGAPYRIDLAYPDLKIAIEADGPHHLLPSIAAYDRRRDADLTLDGWVVLHVYPDTDERECIDWIRSTAHVRIRSMQSGAA
jgi:very-short-patch-repair endonuclease